MVLCHSPSMTPGLNRGVHCESSRRLDPWDSRAKWAKWAKWRFPEMGGYPWSSSILDPIGSMYAVYGNIYHQYTPVMLAYIPYIRILWGLGFFHFQQILQLPLWVEPPLGDPATDSLPWGCGHPAHGLTGTLVLRPGASVHGRSIYFGIPPIPGTPKKWSQALVFGCLQCFGEPPGGVTWGLLPIPNRLKGCLASKHSKILRWNHLGSLILYLTGIQKPTLSLFEGYRPMALNQNHIFPILINWQFGDNVVNPIIIN